jgi:hypothetical protein
MHMAKPRRTKRLLKTQQQEVRALAERKANADAVTAGHPMPFPNMWDVLDPTKVPRDATPEQIHQSYLEFRKLCPPPPRKLYTL